mmetsp:Transcript_19433/g.29871  ORF Transcript_19433/g.29871 Transcript_19433/m.29871 type:complete len:93 (+) Transcript_19433:1105-1383(+)
MTFSVQTVVHSPSMREDTLHHLLLPLPCPPVSSLLQPRSMQAPHQLLLNSQALIVNSLGYAMLLACWWMQTSSSLVFLSMFHSLHCEYLQSL